MVFDLHLPSHSHSSHSNDKSLKISQILAHNKHLVYLIIRIWCRFGAWTMGFGTWPLEIQTIYCTCPKMSDLLMISFTAVPLGSQECNLKCVRQHDCHSYQVQSTKKTPFPLTRACLLDSELALLTVWALFCYLSSLYISSLIAKTDVELCSFKPAAEICYLD